MGRGVAVGVGVSVAVAVGMGAGVAVGCGVGVAAGVAAGCGVGVAVGVGVSVGVLVGVRAGAGVAAGAGVGAGCAHATATAERIVARQAMNTVLRRRSGNLLGLVNAEPPCSDETRRLGKLPALTRADKGGVSAPLVSPEARATPDSAWQGPAVFPQRRIAHPPRSRPPRRRLA